MPRGYTRYVLAVMVGINFLNYLDRFILPVIASKVQDEFHLQDVQLGALATAFLLVYAIGPLSDRLHSLRLALLLLLPPMLVLAGVVAAAGLPAVGRDTRTMEDQWASRRSEGDRPPRLSPQPT